MRKYQTIGELRSEFRKIKSIVAGDTWFVAQALMFLINNLSPRILKIKRKPTDWSIFLGSRLREGKTIQEASKEWKETKKIN